MFVKRSAFRSTLIKWEIGLLVGFGILFAISLMRNSAIEQAIVSDVSTERRIHTSHELEIQLESLLADVALAESGHRGYLLTSNPRFLDIFYSNAESFEPELKNLSGGFSSLGLPSADVVRLSELIGQRYQHWKRTLAAFESGKTSVAADLQIAGEGKDITDEIKSIVNVLAASLRRNRVQLTMESNVSDLATSRINQTTGLMATPIITLLFFLSWRAVRAYYEGIERRVAAAGELEQAVRQRTSELKATKDELEAFSYSVSHDLRGPLRAVISYASMLEEDYGSKLDQDGKEFLDRIKASGRRMSELIDTLLALSRLSRADIAIEEQDASEIATGILKELSNDDPNSGRRVEVEPGIRLMADRKMLTTLMDNLLRNAWKFSSQNDRPEIRVFYDAEKQAIVIQDNGVGFNPDYANKLFLPFQRLHNDREFEGTGIGLAIVDRIVKRHGGQIWAESEVGKGAKFYFQLAPDARAVWREDIDAEVAVR